MSIDEKTIETWLLQHGTVRYNEDGSVILYTSKEQLLEAAKTSEQPDVEP